MLGNCINQKQLHLKIQAWVYECVSFGSFIVKLLGAQKNDVNARTRLANWQCERFACSQQKDVNDRNLFILAMQIKLQDVIFEDKNLALYEK